jgi:hypothetical protein
VGRGECVAITDFSKWCFSARAAGCIGLYVSVCPNEREKAVWGDRTEGLLDLKERQNGQHCNKKRESKIFARRGFHDGQLTIAPQTRWRRRTT